MGPPFEDHPPREGPGTLGDAGSNNMTHTQYDSRTLSGQTSPPYTRGPDEVNPQSPISSRPSGSYDARNQDISLSPPTQDRVGRSMDQTSSPTLRERSKTNGSRRPSGTQRICGKCSGHLTGQFVRALGDTWHLECFTCYDCNKIVASKFFPVPDQPPNQYPLCETDYFKRLDLLCYECGGALRGSYITALERKYHIEHFTCSVCPTVFGAQDSYYEHESNVYCHYHYSTKFAQRCNGCQTAILKQFVKIFRNGQNQHWHPECYMIHKYWNVRLHTSGHSVQDQVMGEADATDEERRLVRREEEKVEEKVLWIWRTLSAFEEKSATCISDMLLHVSNGAYVDGVMAARKFIVHVDLLFGAADNLDWLLTTRTPRSLTYSREAKLLCKKVVAFFQLLSESQETGVRRLGVTQELLSLVTGLAHYLKLLIRICLQGALKLEHETGSTEGLIQFLEEINKLEEKLDTESTKDSFADIKAYIATTSDTCAICEKPVEDKCIRRGERTFHVQCMVCQRCNKDLSLTIKDARWSESSQQLLCDRDAGMVLSQEEGGFVQITRLMQYVHLLRVAHARLLALLRTSGALTHTSDDPNLARYDSDQGHQVSPDGGDMRMLRNNTRSKSYAGSSSKDEQPDATYEQTVSDIKRLRSTRMDKHVSNTTRRARTSRVIGGPEGVRPGSAGNGSERRNQGFQIVQDRDANGEPVPQLTFGNQDSITLDDIPRVVAAHQARDQRPNASRFARGPMIPQEPKPRFVNGHRRDLSSGNGLDRAAGGEPGAYRTKKYFSELTPLEYFVVRHVAVIQLEPLLEGRFNQEELLDLIETKRSTFWGKFGKAFKNDGKKGAGKKKGVFGVSLEQLVERDGAESTDGVGPGALRVPALVQDAVSAMRTMDMSVEGVFRKNGNIRRIKDLAEEIDLKGGDAVDLNKENPVQVAALLKKFLRELPDPVMTTKLFRLFVTSTKIEDEEKRKRVLHLTCCLLPKAHRDTMEILFTFLNWASSFSHVDEESGSKMDIHNLATVITPNILHSSGKPIFGAEEDPFFAIEAVHVLIEYNEAMCEVPEDLQIALNDSALFSSSADITAKEILKRFGDRSRVTQPTVVDPDSSTSRSREGHSSAPVVTHVDTDPGQASAWQNERSVRHVQGPNSQNTTYGPSSTHNTPPQMPYDLGAPNIPYANPPSGSPESHGSPSRSTHRSSAFAKQGALGVTGAG
ncbi:GTPase-activating protein-like protein of the rho/rac family [Cryomyces antarcticus]